MLAHPCAGLLVFPRIRRRNHVSQGKSQSVPANPEVISVLMLATPHRGLSNVGAQLRSGTTFRRSR